MLTLLLLGIPFLAALILFAPKDRGWKNLALIFSLVEFVVSLVAFVIYKQNPASELLHFKAVWIKSLGINFDVSINALSLLMILLTTFLIPIIILSTYKKGVKTSNKFLGLILAFQMAVIGVFMANDGFLFYIFWEITLIPVYLICLLWGGENRSKVTLKFFIYTLIGSLFMLVGLIMLYHHTNVNGLKSWDIQALYAAGRSLDFAQQGLIFWFIFIAFAVKIPIFPFHTWQPDTYVDAPIQGTMILSGIMLKMATFGAIKWLLPMVPLGVQEWGTTVMVLAIIGIVYTSIIALGQNEYKRFNAYISLAHVAVIAAAIFSGTHQGIQGSIMLMLAHGINTVGLFFISEILFRKTGTTMMDEMGGIRQQNGNFSTLFLIIVLGVVALPLTSGFIGEFLSLIGIYQFNPYFAAVAGLSIIFGAVYMLRIFQKIMLGESKNENFVFGKLEPSENIVLIIISIAIIGLGVYPAILNDIAETAAYEALLNIK
ncbi:MAG: NADH-quinone oxidoreductase subunit M [Crocinitomix sp.]|nr:NADH-quinone oxidoreductase subunit M [Crocinitomix sp.]